MLLLITLKLFFLLFLRGSFAGQCFSTQNCICDHRLTFQNKMKLNTDALIYYKIEPNTTYHIGSGGTGSVYHAYWKQRKICVALKITGGNAINKEVKILKHFVELPQNQHDRIIEYYGYKLDHVDNRTFIALELGGKTLSEYYNENRQNEPDLPLLTKLLREAAQALAQFSQRAIHFDIKQSNFIVIDQENGFTVKIIDFGLSVLNGDLQQADIQFGNMARCYLAPEIRFGVGHADQIDRGILTPKIDVWTFGLMSYTLLYGRLNREIRNQGGRGDYTGLDSLLQQYRNNDNNSYLDVIIKNCLQPNPNDRPNINQVVNQLNQIRY
ncbi:Protein kinase domain-containing protein [Meloidogyne graminicola]|uniref:Protein kinase domain-containing protein n=1 Tax=Meloidogyne graminicola TaxID=189291 RepID=A0A8S9ZB79_9BILA|nr:Protein kinase domain-containing protein [Meloidogyne graminicola]